jgi:RNA polymerase sigma-70 factor, ECF subfamily
MLMALLRLLKRRPSLGPDAADTLRAAATGNRDAIAQLFDDNVDALYAFVFFRVGRDAALAEDVVQETLSIAIAKAQSYDSARGSVAAWLTTTSRNVIRDHMRDHRRGSELAATWERIDTSLGQVFAALAQSPLPGDVLHRDETRDLVHMAMANLPPQYRSVLMRKYVDEVSLANVAGELGLSEDATKSLLARARRAFRDTFSSISQGFAEVQS